MNNRVKEIEFNFANKCTADCYLCAKPHGCGNEPFMSPEIFQLAREQLVEVDFHTIQVGGNGDAFLNPHFLDYLRKLKRSFPFKAVVFYTNFFLLTPRMADVFIEEQLLDRLFTRIDTLRPEAYQQCTRLPMEPVMENLSYFIRHNQAIELHIGYSSIRQYHRKCRKVLGVPPLHSPFTDSQAEDFPDEFEEVQAFFESRRWQAPLRFYRINQSLWAERLNPLVPLDQEAVCPKLSTGLLNRITWICPNGDIDVCGYDDTQRIFVAGNIRSATILDIWNGPRRAAILETISERRHVGYPCNNPRACRMYGDNDY